MLGYLLKALYARILAYWMHIHPKAAYYIINTALNHGAFPTRTKTESGLHALRIRRHQTTVLIKRDNCGCTLITWGPGLPAPYRQHMDRFVDVITQTRAALRRQVMRDNDWDTLR